MTYRTAWNINGRCAKIAGRMKTFDPWPILSLTPIS
jgi:hypothetical protein